MTIPTLTATPLADGRLGPVADSPVLLLGPSLGTSASTLWALTALQLQDRFHVVGWDLPGHGHSPTTTEPFTMAELAAAVISLAAELSEHGPVHYAGDSVGGCVGLQVALDAPDLLTSLTVLCSGARIGTADAWHERAQGVRASGTSSMVPGSAERWFSPGFLEREPAIGSALLHALRDADAEGYALTCGALADFDVVDRLPEITLPVLAVAGHHDVATPPESLQTIADGVTDGRLVVLDDVAHLAPAEAPEAVSRLLIDHIGGTTA